jgi:nicotinamidase-related amidase
MRLLLSRLNSISTIPISKSKSNLQTPRTYSTIRALPMSTQLSTSNPYPWPHDSSLSPSTTALLIIDMQRDFLHADGYLYQQVQTQNLNSPNQHAQDNHEALTRLQSIIPRLESLLSTFRRANFPIYHTREGHEPHMATISTREAHRSAVNGSRIGSRGPLGRLLIRGERGHEIISELCPLPTEPIIDKPGRGAFTNTELDAALRGRGIRNLVVCGVTADACVSSTVREASDRGYDVLVVEDGVESMNEGLKRWSLEAIRVEGGLFGVTAECRDISEVVESWVNAKDTGN